MELFRQREPLVFTPTHRLAKEMRERGVRAQTYLSFFRWSGQTEWTPDRMGNKFPRVIIWNEVCTVPCPTLETFLDWLERRGVQVVCCGDQGQPPPITGEMPHDWLPEHANY
ncbi:MAG: AAA family ATPase [Candidatus Thiodiazotropha sp.]